MSRLHYQITEKILVVRFKISYFFIDNMILYTQLCSFSFPVLFCGSIIVSLQYFNGIFLKKPPFSVVGEVMSLRIKYAEKNNHCHQIMVIFKTIIPEALLKKQ